MKRKIIGQEIAPGVFETSDYSAFTFVNNRPINRKNVNKKKKSISEHGQLTPIVITKEYAIKEGQHRFIACKELGIPVIYIFSLNETLNIHEISEMNSNTEKWSLNDYLEAYADAGKESYVLIRQLKKNNPEINMNEIFTAIGKTSGESFRKFKSGDLVISTNTYEFAKYILSKSLSIYKVIKQNDFVTRRYLEALISLLKFDIYTYDDLFQAMEKRHHLLKKSASKLDAVINIEYAYNYGLKEENKKRIQSEYQDMVSKAKSNKSKGE